MKEITKYSSYRFIGRSYINEIMPWFDFDKGKPWDEEEVPWVLENKVRRQILILLANKGPMTLQEILEKINFSPKPLLVSNKEYSTKIEFKWTHNTVENHLTNLEWYGLIKKHKNKYHITFPILTFNDLESIEKYTLKIAKNWLDILEKLKSEIEETKIENIEVSNFYEILLEKSIEHLINLLKQEGILPRQENLKTLWGEQLREIRFEEWLRKFFVKM